MAEIKSSIQIAMERAAAMGGAASKAEVAAEEGKRLGRTLGRRAVAGDMAPEALLQALADLPAEKRSGARAAAAQALITDLEEGRHQALPALLALAQDTPVQEPLHQLAAILSLEGSAEEKLHQELALEMAAQLKALGLGGDAIRPNPAAHPHLKARMEQSMARLEDMRASALGELKAAFAG